MSTKLYEKGEYWFDKLANHGLIAMAIPIPVMIWGGTLLEFSRIVPNDFITRVGFCGYSLIILSVSLMGLAAIVLVNRALKEPNKIQHTEGLLSSNPSLEPNQPPSLEDMTSSRESQETLRNREEEKVK